MPKPPNAKHSWTSFEFRARSVGVTIEGDLDFTFPMTPAKATHDALNKAEFLATAYGFDWDSNNVRMILYAKPND